MSRRFGAFSGAIALAMVCLIASPAAAAQSWNLSGSSGYGGSLESSGSLDFTGAKAFSYNFTVRDICPGDSRSAIVEFQIYYKDGTSNLSQDFADSSGCGPNAVPYSGSISKSKNIDYVQVLLLSRDLSSGAPGVYVDQSTNKDNPYT